VRCDTGCTTCVFVVSGVFNLCVCCEWGVQQGKEQGREADVLGEWTWVPTAGGSCRREAEQRALSWMMDDCCSRV
jgi:hypothetical protein